MNKRFLHNLKMLRMRAGLTQYKLSNDLNLGFKTYRNIEYGNQEPKIKHLVLFAEYFKVSIDDLIFSEL